MPYGTVNADVIQTSTSGGILGAGNASIMKNRIINGAMVISQYNGTSSVTPTGAAYLIDRWQVIPSQSSKLSFQQNAGSVTPPVGFTNYLGATSLSAYSLVTSDYFLLTQKIEGFNSADLGWGTANAKTVTISFWVRSSLTGTFGAVIRNNAGDRVYPFTYTISSANTWEYETITVAGDTSGTWLTTNGIGIEIDFGLGVASNLSATAGAWTTGGLGATGATSVVGTNGATFYITGVQLEVGSSATGYEYRQITQELILCQRYFQKSYNLGVAVGTNTTIGSKTTRTFNTDAFLPNMEARLLVSLRATPTVTWYTTTGVSGSINVGVTTNTINTIYQAGENTTGWLYVNGSVASGNQLEGQFTVSAEL